MEITVGEHSVRHIRRIVRSLLHEWELEPLTFAVELGVSELVTNVVRHVPDRRCRVVVARQAAGSGPRSATASPRCPGWRPRWTRSPRAAGAWPCWTPWWTSGGGTGRRREDRVVRVPRLPRRAR
ncbi:ATP-binding protein [Streptomyces nogalater]